MVDASSLGEPRAKIVTEFVKELNDSVAGSYVEEVPEALLETNPTFFSQFTVVIATQVGLIDGMDRKLSLQQLG
jgi:amyloid beta precursor protein binding protein 1